MNKENNRLETGYWRDVFSDNDGRGPSFRVMAMIGMLTGCSVLVALALGFSDMDLNTPMAFLFGGIFCGKAAQKFAENNT